MPAGLRNEADWRYFQAELDRSALIVVGRLAHEATPNVKARRRLVMSRASQGLERRGGEWWWHPERVSWNEVAERLTPEGGSIAVPGGRAAFDFFLGVGFRAFHLSRVSGLSLPGGRALFSACDQGISAERALAQAGLKAEASVTLDAIARVSLTVWRAADDR